jgi:hypothetical protein
MISADDTITHSKKDSNEKGTGQLRYVAINIARESGAAQITLVWNALPPPPPSLVGPQRGTEFEFIDDPVLRKLVSKLLVMSSASITNNPSNVVDDENDREVTDSIDAATYPTACRSGDPLPPKKRRRRGRQEGRASSVNGDSNVNDQRDNFMSNNIMVSDASNKTKQRKQTKLTLHSLWINYNQSWRHSNAIFAVDSTCWQHIYGPHTIIEHLNFDINNHQ